MYPTSMLEHHSEHLHYSLEIKKHNELIMCQWINTNMELFGYTIFLGRHMKRFSFNGIWIVGRQKCIFVKRHGIVLLQKNTH